MAIKPITYSLITLILFNLSDKANKAYLIPDKLREFMDKDPNAIKSIAPTLRKIERVNDLDFSESFRKVCHLKYFNSFKKIWF